MTRISLSGRTRGLRSSPRLPSRTYSTTLAFELQRLAELYDEATTQAAALMHDWTEAAEQLEKNTENP